MKSFRVVTLCFALLEASSTYLLEYLTNNNGKTKPGQSISLERRLMAKPKVKLGSVVKIKIDDKYHTYGRVLKTPFIAVYDFRTNEEIDNLTMITSKPVLFVIAVYNQAISRKWINIGNVPLKEHDTPIPDQFIQDVDIQKCRIIDAQGKERVATIDECEGLECAAVWNAEHVEERLRDYYAGRKNVSLEHMKLKR